MSFDALLTGICGPCLATGVGFVFALVTPAAVTAPAPWAISAPRAP